LNSETEIKSNSFDFKDKVEEINKQSEIKKDNLLKKFANSERKRKELVFEKKNKILSVVLKERETHLRVMENNRKIEENKIKKQNKILEKHYYSLEKSVSREESLNKGRKEI
jgi:hypothetical protein